MSSQKGYGFMGETYGQFINRKYEENMAEHHRQLDEVFARNERWYQEELRRIDEEYGKEPEHKEKTVNINLNISVNGSESLSEKAEREIKEAVAKALSDNKETLSL